MASTESMDQIKDTCIFKKIVRLPSKEIIYHYSQLHLIRSAV